MPAFLKPSGQIAGEAFEAGVRGFQTGESILAERQRRDVIKRQQELREAAEARRADLHDVTKRQAFSTLRGSDIRNDVDARSADDRVRAFGLRNENTEETVRGQQSRNTVLEATEGERIAQAGANLDATRTNTRSTDLSNQKKAGTLKSDIGKGNSDNYLKMAKNASEGRLLPGEEANQRRQQSVDEFNLITEQTFAEAQASGATDVANVKLNQIRQDALGEIYNAAIDDPQAAVRMIKDLTTLYFDDDMVDSVEFEGDKMYVVDKDGKRLSEDPDGPRGPKEPKVFELDTRAFKERRTSERLPETKADQESVRKMAEREATEEAKARNKITTTRSTGAMTAKQYNDASIAITKYNNEFFDIGRRSTDIERNFSAFVSEQTIPGENDPAEVTKRYNTLIEEALAADRPFATRKAERDARQEYMKALMEMSVEQ